jgi:ribosomal protein S19
MVIKNNIKNLLVSKASINKSVKPNSKIRASHIGMVCSIPLGKGFAEVRVLDNMVGHFFGEFIFTKRLGNTIHNKKNKKSRK